MAKCADCGFLQQRLQGEASPWQPISPEFRETGKPASDRIFPIPRCAAGARDLKQWVAETPGQGRQAKVHSIFQEEWNCPEFTELRPERSPKEHFELRELEVLRESQQRREDADMAFRERMAEKERVWRDEQRQILNQQAVEDREWRREEMDWRSEQAEKEMRWRQREFKWVGLGAIFILGGLTIIAALIERGILF